MKSQELQFRDSALAEEPFMVLTVLMLLRLFLYGHVVKSAYN